MKTSANVLGIQAEQTLKRIEATWQAVVHTGEAPARVRIIGDSREVVKAIFAKEEPVLPEERLSKEIPEPNWRDGKVPLLTGMIDGGALKRRRAPNAGGAEARRRIACRTSITRGRQEQAVRVFTKTGQNIAQKQRYTRSSLSPPDLAGFYQSRE